MAVEGIGYGRKAISSLGWNWLGIQVVERFSGLIPNAPRDLEFILSFAGKTYKKRVKLLKWKRTHRILTSMVNIFCEVKKPVSFKTTMLESKVKDIKIEAKIWK